ncbi:DUF192 domain-containing protein [Chitinophaga sp. ysch24]|uniref:DUF192 domain-containing protein n=2 Tax=Chitinophaga tropicalis TaxID=2683588 RepID=A0A7K1U3C8_9BACT|nr:DUF192 domain-containing protein [Chitinophaga tropicalis]
MYATKWLFNALLSVYLAGCHNNGSNQVIRSEKAIVTASNDGPVFRKEGELYFLSKINNDTLRKIDVEFATTDEERAQGLMDRKSMTDDQGMLFIFAKAEEQSFWMKNTYISLDIIYLDEKKEIVSVQKYTTPLSEESLPSFKKAQYALEVNAGFCDKYHIAYGDKIVYRAVK